MKTESMLGRLRLLDNKKDLLEAQKIIAEGLGRCEELEKKKACQDEIKKLKYQFSRSENMAVDDRDFYVCLKRGLPYHQARHIIGIYNLDLDSELNRFCLDYKIRKRDVLDDLKELEALKKQGAEYIQKVREEHEAKLAKTKSKAMRNPEAEELLKV